MSQLLCPAPQKPQAPSRTPCSHGPRAQKESHPASQPTSYEPCSGPHLLVASPCLPWTLPAMHHSGVCCAAPCKRYPHHAFHAARMAPCVPLPDSRDSEPSNSLSQLVTSHSKSLTNPAQTSFARYKRPMRSRSLRHDLSILSSSVFLNCDVHQANLNPDPNPNPNHTQTLARTLILTLALTLTLTLALSLRQALHFRIASKRR